MSVSLDDRLKKFLEDADRDKLKGYTNANILTKVEFAISQLNEVNSRVDHIEHRLDRHGREIRAIKERIEYDGELDTGQHSIEAIQKEVERQRTEHDMERRAKQDEVVWWKRQITMWVVGAIGFLIIQVVGVIISVALSTHK